jgi:hypothetical protein
MTRTTKQKEQRPDSPNNRQPQRWRTFLRNLRDVIASMDFLVVPTVRFNLLYVWFVIEHDREAAVLPERLRLRRPRRQILHVDITAHPT